MAKKNILLIGNTDMGGVSSVSDTMLYSKLLNKEFNFFTLSTSNNLIYKETDKTGVKISQILRRLKLLIKIIGSVIKIKPHLIHYHTVGDYSFLSDLINLVVIKAMGFKVIFHYHNDPTSEFSKFPSQNKKNWKSLLFQFGINKCNIFIVLGEKYKSFIYNNFKIDGNIVRSLYNTVPGDLSKYIPQKNKHIYKTLKILYLGRLSKLKGIFDFLEIASIANNNNLNITFLIAGDYDTLRDKNCVMDLINRFRLKNYRLLGEVQDKKKLLLLEDVDILIFPSIYEGLPVSILEASYFEVPTIAYNHGMIEEIIINDKTGFVIEKRNIEEMYKALIYLYKNRNKISEFGMNAKKHLQNTYSKHLFESTLLDYYKNITN